MVQSGEGTCHSASLWLVSKIEEVLDRCVLIDTSVG